MANLGVALLALLVSLLSFGVSFAAYRLARTQDERKKPLLIPSLIDGHVQYIKDEQVRVYAFLLSIRNPTDSDNSIAEMELQITYRTSNGARVTARLSSNMSNDDAFHDKSGFASLRIPTRLDAHQTQTGWCEFRTSEDILANATIEGYEVALFDSHGVKATVEPIIVQELRS